MKVGSGLHLLCRIIVANKIRDKRLFNKLWHRLRTFLQRLPRQGSGKGNDIDSDTASDAETDANINTDTERDTAIDTTCDACIVPTPTLMDLPVELRIMIHRYALQGVIDDANANAGTDLLKKSNLNFGGLALGNSHCMLRAEMHDVFVPMMMKLLQQQVDHNVALVSRFEQSARTYANPKAMVNVFQYPSTDATYLDWLASNYALHRGGKLFEIWLAMINRRLETESELSERKMDVILKRK